jgi:hypothetical protein
MNLKDLLEEVGIDNVGVQFLDHCATNFTWNEKRKTSKVTFETDQRFSMEGLDSVGIVVWLPREKALAAMSAGRAKETVSE